MSLLPHHWKFIAKHFYSSIVITDTHIVMVKKLSIADKKGRHKLFKLSVKKWTKNIYSVHWEGSGNRSC